MPGENGAMPQYQLTMDERDRAVLVAALDAVQTKMIEVVGVLGEPLAGLVSGTQDRVDDLRHRIANLPPLPEQAQHEVD